MEIDLDHLRNWIGSEDSAEEQLTSALVQRFNATLNRTSAREAGAEAPALIHLCLCQPATSTAELGPDGHPARGAFLPPVPLPRRMWAGGQFTFHTPIRVGANVARKSLVRDVTEKKGRSGSLCFVTVEHAITSDGTLAVTERQDIVYREAAKPEEDITRSALPPAANGDQQRRIEVNAPLLFRYSALTFNSHRIHYDTPYSRTEEHYPGLVVHGPLQATHLCNFAAALREAMPAKFEFRSLAPIFDTDDFVLHASDEDDGLKLWTAVPGGPLAMEASARW